MCVRFKLPHICHDPSKPRRRSSKIGVKCRCKTRNTARKLYGSKEIAARWSCRLFVSYTIRYSRLAELTPNRVIGSGDVPDDLLGQPDADDSHIRELNAGEAKTTDQMKRIRQLMNSPLISNCTCTCIVFDVA